MLVDHRPHPTLADHLTTALIVAGVVMALACLVWQAWFIAVHS